MTLLDLTFPSPPLNLACDEALLDFCEAGLADEVLRFWEPAQYFVAVGYANSAATEANLSFCQTNHIPVLRRCTGGGTVLQGPGVLNYSVVLRIAGADALHTIPATNRFVLQRQQQAFAGLVPGPVEIRGHTDLALGGLKFSGNAQRRKKHCLLFHGSFLLNLDIALVEKALPMPSHRPTYRADRPHSAFLTNLNLPAQTLKAALTQAWAATSPAVPGTPALAARQDLLDEIHRLARTKYEISAWNLKF